MARTSSKIAALAVRVGGNVKKLRNKRGLTLDQLADLADASKGYLSTVETGQRLPSLPMLLAIANGLEVGVDELVV
jgi:transcriptional regulator with XRE-family HTH domain